jgi:hypothetical protein
MEAPLLHFDENRGQKEKEGSRIGKIEGGSLKKVGKNKTRRGKPAQPSIPEGILDFPSP